MINQICESLTIKYDKKMPDIDDEEAEVIKYGPELIIGEVPKYYYSYYSNSFENRIFFNICILIRRYHTRLLLVGFHLKQILMYNWNTFYLLWKCFNK